MSNKLPSEYKELQYITSQYETFLRLGTTFGQADTTDIFIDCETTANSAFWGGSDTSSVSAGYYAGARVSGANIIWYSDDDGGTASGVWSHNTRHTYEWVYTGSRTKGTYVDDILVDRCGDWDGYENLYVLYGKFPTGGDKTYFYGNVYQVKVAGHVFTPALRVADNVAGFYCDTGEFYESGGDAPFVAGPLLKTSTIFKGIKNIPTIYKGLTPIKSVYFRGQDLFGGGSPLEPIEYDYILEGEYDEVDIIYTTDTHLRWLGNSGSDYTYSPVFSLDNVAYYKDKLWDNGIPAFLVDCGDWVHGGTNTEALRNEIISFFNNCGSKGLTKYLSVTYGNHEWYSAVGDAPTCIGYMDRISNMSACNLLQGGNTKYKPYRAIKVGDKKIAIIAVGYPSPNGRDGTTGSVRTFGGYTFYDAEQTTSLNPNSALYKQVQKYIDKFRKRNFDYIIVNTHMDKYSDESFSADNRFNSRADLLIQNTDGIDLVIPGHYNYEIDQIFTFTGTGGHQGVIVQEAGASMHTFGRIKLKFDGTVPESYLLKSQSDLEVI